MRILDELEREIERIAVEADAAPKRRRWWRSSGLLVLFPLGLATVAVAATTGILAGEPVKDPQGANRNPRSGLGVSVDRGKLLDVRAPDPDGGPAWAIRLVKSSRGLGCVQLGRTVDSKLGILGRDGAFDDDGRFHERSSTIISSFGCQRPDAAGTIFTAMSVSGLPSSGDMSACRARPAGARRSRLDCAPGALRDIAYGLLGPEAVAITYTDDQDQTVRQPVTPPEGAYLIVRRTRADQRNVGSFDPRVSPTGTAVDTIEYRDGTSCQPARARRLHGVRRCPLKGYHELRRTPVPADELRSPVRVRVSVEPERPKVNGKALPPAVRGQRRITVTFRARRGADATSFYTVSMQTKGAKNCDSGPLLGPIARDIAAGTIVTQDLWVPYACRGTATITVGYEQQTDPSDDPFTPTVPVNAKVGTATVAVG